MNIIYKDDTLYVDVNQSNSDELNNLKSRVFSVLSQYKIKNVVVNTNGVNNPQMNSFVEEYHKNYNGKLIINSED